MSTIRPMGPHVLIQQDAAKSTAGGLIIPESSQTVPSRGTVLAVGPDVDAVTEGDRVLFTRYAGDEVEIDGVTLLIVDCADLLGVIVE